MAERTTRRTFLSKAAKGTGIVTAFGTGLLGDLKFNKKQGVGVAKEKLQLGMSTANATCGMGLNCSGGGGECGMGLNCGGGGGDGGGGQCGMGLNCSGGGGECGMGLNCGGG